MKYLIGPLAVLKELFLDHNFDQERKSLDGSQVVIEKDVDEKTIGKVTIEQSVTVATHAEALEILNGPLAENVWYKSDKKKGKK